MVDNIVVCVQRRKQVFDVMKILMNVRCFLRSVEMVEHVSMKSVDIDVIVRQVGLERHVRKRSIIVFLNHANVMERVFIEWMVFNVDVHRHIQETYVNMILMNVWSIHV